MLKLPCLKEFHGIIIGICLRSSSQIDLPSSSESLRTARFLRPIGEPLPDREPERERDREREPERLLAEPPRLRLRLRLTLREPDRDREPDWAEVIT